MANHWPCNSNGMTLHLTWATPDKTLAHAYDRQHAYNIMTMKTLWHVRYIALGRSTVLLYAVHGVGHNSSLQFHARTSSIDLFFSELQSMCRLTVLWAESTTENMHVYCLSGDWPINDRATRHLGGAEWKYLPSFVKLENKLETWPGCNSKLLKWLFDLRSTAWPVV